MHPNDVYVERVVDLLDPAANRILNMTVEEARERVLAAQVFERARCSSHFALTVHASELGAL
jgi:hypothetical protein